MKSLLLFIVFISFGLQGFCRGGRSVPTGNVCVYRYIRSERINEGYVVYKADTIRGTIKCTLEFPARYMFYVITPSGVRDTFNLRDRDLSVIGLKDKIDNYTRFVRLHVDTHSAIKSFAHSVYRYNNQFFREIRRGKMSIYDNGEDCITDGQIGPALEYFIVRTNDRDIIFKPETLDYRSCKKRFANLINNYYGLQPDYKTYNMQQLVSYLQD